MRGWNGFDRRACRGSCRDRCRIRIGGGDTTSARVKPIESLHDRPNLIGQ